VNVILVLIDSLNKSALGAYGPTSVQTPNLSAFARSAVRFHNHFVGSLPCMPARREIFSGFQEFLWRDWGSLEPFDERLPRLLEAHGRRTGIVTDHYHYWEEPANGYIQSFQSAELIRGHEIDFWRPPLRPDEPVPGWVERVERYRPGMARSYWANVRDFGPEEDYFPAKVFGGAGRWLEENSSGGPFFLQVESFDVHEPFHAPEPYRSLYADGSRIDDFNIWPPYQDSEAEARFLADATPDDLDFIRAQYAAKVTMVDRWFGEFMGTVERLGLLDDTAIIVTTDHGHDLAERGRFGKQFPHHDSHANIPLMVRAPGVAPGEREALTTTLDLFATVLDLAGAQIPAGSRSRSLLPLLRDASARGRDAILYGTFGQGICCTDGRWTVIKSPVSEGPLHRYTQLRLRPIHPDDQAGIASGHYIPGVVEPQWRVPVRGRPTITEDRLYDRASDPRQVRNLWDEQPEERERMLELTRALMRESGVPAEQYERLGL
jgi:arylsulfatase A-like enzyme